MARMLLASWWATVLRGLAALGLALLCLTHAPATPADGARVFGAYAAVDGLLCGLVVIRAERRRPRTALSLASLAGVGVGAALLVAPRVSPAVLALAMASWALAVGVTALASWQALYQAAPAAVRVVEMGSGVQRRRLATPEFGMLLAGALALTFALATPALSAAGIGVSGLIGLFAAPFGYLHLRAGLSLGVLALAAADAGGPAGPSAAEGDFPAMRGGTA